MLIHRGYKFRIYPTSEQEQALAKAFGCVRFVFNHYLQVRQTVYRIKGKGIGYNQTAGMLTRLKKTKRFTWLNEVNAQMLQQSLRDLDAAYQNFFAGRAKFPKFKSKHDSQSLRYPNQAVRVEYRDKRHSTIWLSKIGEVKLIAHKPILGTVKNVTISKTKSGRYYASLSVEVSVAEEVPEKPKREVGLDVGLKHFLVSSEGEKQPAPKYLRKAEKRIKRLQRKLSRRKKGGKNREKARLALARAYEKVTAQRENFTHQLSTTITRSCTLVGIEDLSVKGMLANHHLAKSIADAGWGMFFRQIEYKGLWNGCSVVQIGRFFPSSKTCSHCGFVLPKLSLKVREWTCPNCATLHDRDINAATNILIISTRGRLFPEVTPAESHNPVQLRLDRLVEAGIRSPGG